MFGLSTSKLALLFLVVAALWFGWRLYRRGHAAQARANSFLTPEEARPCAVCGSFVAASLGRPCGRDNCPFGA